jgi:hypothetical protein
MGKRGGTRRYFSKEYKLSIREILMARAAENFQKNWE